MGTGIENCTAVVSSDRSMWDTAIKIEGNEYWFGPWWVLV